jgi:hypothetical protein
MWLVLQTQVATALRSIVGGMHVQQRQGRSCAVWQYQHQSVDKPFTTEEVHMTS